MIWQNGFPIGSMEMRDLATERMVVKFSSSRILFFVALLWDRYSMSFIAFPQMRSHLSAYVLSKSIGMSNMSTLLYSIVLNWK